MLEVMTITTSDGSTFALNPRLISCVAKRSSGALGDAKASICTVYWLGGGQLTVNGANYDDLFSLWNRAIESWKEYGD
jgi:hypothetical protein